ncbi:trypsin-like peptidase domain-containing protein [Vibrio parahaemolyticus]|nr:trypsin-like peptidase domain-containing protein [Vibrio parahaemolyticus]
MALIPPFFLNCVVAIGIQPTVTMPTVPIQEPSWIGTGFLVGRPIEGTSPTQYTIYLVTNKHVIQGLQSVVVRFNQVSGAGTLDIPLVLSNNGIATWFGHPDPNIDVAVAQVNHNVLNQLGSRYNFFELDQHSMNTASLYAVGASEGDFIYVLGYPMGQVTPQTNYVIARSGSIARIRDVLQGNQSNYLIDASVYPGNSGGPVISKPEMVSITGTQSNPNSRLIGMVKAYIPYHDTAISQQTKRTRIIFEENSGLALVETVDSIEFTVNLAHSAINLPTP